jgi:hypothetical protein
LDNNEKYTCYGALYYQMEHQIGDPLYVLLNIVQFAIELDWKVPGKKSVELFIESVPAEVHEEIEANRNVFPEAVEYVINSRAGSRSNGSL